jgi:hypothetical protein
MLKHRVISMAISASTILALALPAVASATARYGG